MIPSRNAVQHRPTTLEMVGIEQRESYQESSIIRKPRHTCCEFHSQLTPSYFLCVKTSSFLILPYLQGTLESPLKVKSNECLWIRKFSLRGRSVCLSRVFENERRTVNTIARNGGIIVYPRIRLINIIFYASLLQSIFLLYHFELCKIYYKQSLE